MEYASRGVIPLLKAFPLHEKVFPLRSQKVIGTQNTDIFFKSGLLVATEPESLHNPQISLGEMFGMSFEMKVLVELWR